MIITSTAADGTRYSIEIVKTKAREGTVRIQSWKPGKKGKASTDDTTRLYDMTATANGNQVQCLARVFGPDPVVRFDLGFKVLAVTVKGAITNNGLTRHPVSTPDLTALRTYVVACKFPAIAKA